MSFRNTVVFTTWLNEVPPASRTAFRFSNTRSVCCRTSVPTSSPDCGSRATCPERNRKPFDLIACEYGPIGLGPRAVKITSFMKYAPLLQEMFRQKRIADAEEGREF